MAYLHRRRRRCNKKLLTSAIVPIALIVRGLRIAELVFDTAKLVLIEVAIIERLLRVLGRFKLAIRIVNYTRVKRRDAIRFIVTCFREISTVDYSIVQDFVRKCERKVAEAGSAPMTRSFCGAGYYAANVGRKVPREIAVRRL